MFFEVALELAGCKSFNYFSEGGNKGNGPKVGEVHGVKSGLLLYWANGGLFEGGGEGGVGEGGGAKITCVIHNGVGKVRVNEGW